MRQTLRFTLIIIMLIAFAIFAGTVSAQSPTGGQSGIQVVNINTGTPAGVTVQAVYYAEDGTKYQLQDQTLTNLGDSYTYFGEPQSVSSFNGGAILSAGGPIAASVNTIFNGGLGAGYNGDSSGSTSILLPVVQKNYFGSTSIIGIQNTDTQSQKTIKVTYTEQGQAPFSKTYDVNAGAGRQIDLASDADFGDGWIGSAVVEPQDGATNVVAVVFNYTSQRVFGYTGFANTGTEYYLPLIRSGFAGKITGIGVVDADAGNSPITVDVEYTGFVDKNSNFVNDSGEAYTCNLQATLPNGESIIFFNAGSQNFNTIFGGDGTATVTGGDCQTNGDANFDAAGGPFLGSAKVTGSANIAVQVNDERLNGTSSGAYNGYLASEAGTKIISPIMRNNLFGTSTGVQIQKITGTSVNCTGKYTTGSITGVNTNQTTPPDQSFILTDTNLSETFFLETQWTQNQDPQFGNDSWIGSLIVTCTGGTIVGEINDEPAGDASVYNTFKIE